MKKVWEFLKEYWGTIVFLIVCFLIIASVIFSRILESRNTVVRMAQEQAAQYELRQNISGLSADEFSCFASCLKKSEASYSDCVKICKKD